MAVKIVKTKKGVQISARGVVPPKVPPMDGGRAFKPLYKELGEEKIALIDRMLQQQGKTCTEVAKIIKADWGLMDGFRLDSLKSYLTKYKSTVLAPKLVYVQEEGAKALSKFAEKVDVLENLTRLVEMQQARVSKALAVEELRVTLSYHLKFEIQTLAMLYKQLSELQMDMGLVRKVPAKLQVEATATRTQQLLSEAMQKSERVDNALIQAYKVLEGKFTVEPPNVASRKH